MKRIILCTAICLGIIMCQSAVAQSVILERTPVVKNGMSTSGSNESVVTQQPITSVTEGVQENAKQLSVNGTGQQGLIIKSTPTAAAPQLPANQLISINNRKNTELLNATPIPSDRN